MRGRLCWFPAGGHHFAATYILDWTGWTRLDPLDSKPHRPRRRPDITYYLLGVPVTPCAHDSMTHDSWLLTSHVFDFPAGPDPDSFIDSSTLSAYQLFASQVNKLVSLADHIKSLKKQPKKPLTNERDRKKFLKEFYPDLRIVKHPTTGKDCIPVEQDMLMVVGNRTSASKVKEEEYDSKPDAKAAHQRAREAVDVKTNKKARWIELLFFLRFFSFSFLPINQLIIIIIIKNFKLPTSNS